LKNATLIVLSVLLLSPTFSSSAVEVIQEAAHDVSPPLRSIPTDALNAVEARRPRREIPLGRLVAPPGAQTSASTAIASQLLTAPLVPATLGLNFDGLGVGFSGPQGPFTVRGVPPDPNGAVGDTQYVQWVNTSFAVFDKATGAVVYGPVGGNTLWQGFGGQCQQQNDGDPIVLFDQIARRWVFQQFAVTGGAGNYYDCVAVSTTSDATGTYNRYAFPMPNFNDYPKIAVWPDAYYASFNMFTSGSMSASFIGGYACAFDRTSMLAGTAATAQCFQLSSAYGGLLPSDLDGSNPPPAGSPNYYMAIDTNSLDLWNFHVDFATPANTTFTGPTLIPVNPYSQACGGGICIPQPGTSQQLDSLGDRLMHRLAYRHFGNYETVVANHSVDNGGSAAIRWYEIRDPGGTPTVYQQGTYAPDATSRWMGSIGMDAKGNIAIGYSTSSTTVAPSISYTGRLASDPLGTLQTENVILSGTGSQTGTSRWGDYTSITIDPIDDCTFWYTNEYLNTSGQFNWNTRIASFKFPKCTRAAPNDFNGDGTSDLLWRNANGAAAIWLMNGTTALSSGGFGPYSGWTVLGGEADFNGDGKSDLIWTRTDGAASIWLMNGTTPLSSAAYGPYPGWTLMSGNADFNGDGNTDLVWTHTSGAVSIWLMSGTTVLSTASFGPYAGWTLVSANNDFNGDGRSDLLWTNSNGAASIWLMNGTTPLSAAAFGPYPGWTVLSGDADYNGDGKTDLLWINTNGAASIWLMNGTTPVSAAAFGPYPGWTVVSGKRDFNGDGKSDLLWTNTNGAASVWLMNGTTVTSTGAYGPYAGWSIVGSVGDFNGDGKTDLLWSHTSGAVSPWLMNGTAVTSTAAFGPYPGWTIMSGRTGP
jgi:uncharacterized membrane protein